MNVTKNKPSAVVIFRGGRLSVAGVGVTVLLTAILLIRPADAGERPFKGRIDGQFVATPTPGSTIYASAAQADGNGTHLGRFTKVTNDVLDVATGQTEGSFTMTAANGDRLTGKYSGFFVFGSTPGSFSWRLDTVITGGTGRFFYAKGNFVFTANGQGIIGTDGVVRGNYTETFDGSIEY